MPSLGGVTDSCRLVDGRQRRLGRMGAVQLVCALFADHPRSDIVHSLTLIEHRAAPAAPPAARRAPPAAPAAPLAPALNGHANGSAVPYPLLGKPFGSNSSTPPSSRPNSVIGNKAPAPAPMPKPSVPSKPVVGAKPGIPGKPPVPLAPRIQPVASAKPSPVAPATAAGGQLDLAAALVDAWVFSLAADNCAPF
jgi:hypothetical protein